MVLPAALPRALLLEGCRASARRRVKTLAGSCPRRLASQFTPTHAGTSWLSPPRETTPVTGDGLRKGRSSPTCSSDEINRLRQDQSALLEAMQERAVTLLGTTDVPDLFRAGSQNRSSSRDLPSPSPARPLLFRLSSPVDVATLEEYHTAPGRAAEPRRALASRLALLFAAWTGSSCRAGARYIARWSRLAPGLEARMR